MKNRDNLKALNFLLMFQHGLVLLIFGPLVPGIMKTFDIKEGMTGLLLGIGSLGFMVGPLIAGAAIDKTGVKKVVMLGFLGEMVFFALFGASPLFLFAAMATFCLHLTASFVETSGNVMPTLIKGNHAGSYMNLVHFFFSVGAFISPFLIGLYIGATGRWRPVLFFMMIPTAILLVYAKFIRFPAADKGDVHQMQGFDSLKQTLRDRPAMFGSLTLLLYVGAEVGFSAWVVYYLQSKLGYKPVIASGGLSIVWIGLMVGRFANALLAKKFSSKLLVSTAGIGGLAAGLIFLGLESLYAVYPCLFIIGLCMSGIFPNVMAEINSREPERAGTVTGIMTMGAGAGAMIFQWFVGFIAERTTITVGLIAPAVLMGLLVISYFIALIPKKTITAETG